MNGKKAKKLRKFINERYSKSPLVGYEDGKNEEVRLTPNTKRYNYQVLKRKVKLGEINENSIHERFTPGVLPGQISTAT